MPKEYFFISDMHIGPTIGKSAVEAIVERVNAEKPDIVAITGDLVDGSVEELAESVAPLAHLQARFAEDLAGERVVARAFGSLQRGHAFEQQCLRGLCAAEPQQDRSGLHEAPAGRVRPAGRPHEIARTVRPGERAFVIAQGAEGDADGPDDRTIQRYESDQISYPMEQ